MANFSVNDFFVIVEAKDNPVKWSKKRQGSGWTYKFKIDGETTKIKSEVVNYDDAGWSLNIETNASLIDAPDAFFATVASAAQDFIRTEKPGPSILTFFGEQNMTVGQVSLLKRKLKETKYKIRIQRNPDAFAIIISKD